MQGVEIYYRPSSGDLSLRELEFLFEAQRCLLVQKLGVLGLTADLGFLFAYESGFRLDCVSPIGVLAFRNDDDGGLWVQIAYVSPESRRRKVFCRLVRELESMRPVRPIGFGVRAANAPMIAALERLGYHAPKLYFEKLLPAPAECAPASP